MIITSDVEYVPEDYFRALDLADVFSRAGRVEVDLGCGEGAFLIAMAARHPERNFIGTERLLGRVRNTLRKVERAGLTNVRLMRVESAYLVKRLLPAGSVGRVYVMFPDPWPKRRHWPRRLLNAEFLRAAAVALEPGGEVCIKTDDADYFQWIRKCAEGCGELRAAEWDEEMPMTDFERHYVAEGRRIYSTRLVAQVVL